jgi:hypothetical protein
MRTDRERDGAAPSVSDRARDWRLHGDQSRLQFSVGEQSACAWRVVASERSGGPHWHFESLMIVLLLTRSTVGMNLMVLTAFGTKLNLGFDGTDSEVPGKFCMASGRVSQLDIALCLDPAEFVFVPACFTHSFTLVLVAAVLLFIVLYQ